MNLHQLELFLAVAEAGSVTRGAERVAVGQPAVSRAVADLEAAVGERLFDRGPKGVTPTAAGTVLLDYARRIFALEREATEALSDLRGLEAGRLAIGASTTVGEHLLPGVVAAFGLRHPGVELSMEVANTEAVQAGVLEGRYDVGFTEGRIDEGRDDAARFAVGALTQDELLVFAAPAHPLAARGEATLAELAPHAFVVREAGSGTRRVVEDAMRAAGFAPRVAASLGSTTAVKAGVAAGLGLGVASSLALAGELARGELVAIRTPLTLGRTLHVVRLGWRRESAALRRFMRLLNASLGGEP